MALHLTMYAGLGVAPGESDPDARRNAAGISGITHANGNTLRQILKGSSLLGYSIVEGTGFYEGLREPCLIVSVICPEPEEAAAVEQALLRVAEEYKAATRQQEVWITRRVEDLIIV